MIVFKFPSGPLRTNAILIGDGSSGAVIDPAMGSTDKILKQAAKHNLNIEKILLTHSHWDHIVDVKRLKEETGALLYVHPLDAKNIEMPGTDGLPIVLPIEGAHPDRFLKEGEIIEVGSIKLEVICTPGHSPGSVCFYSRGENILFSGDTLFFRATGRLDLATGNPELFQESLEKLARLPPHTRVVPGHGPDTEIGQEL